MLEDKGRDRHFAFVPTPFLGGGQDKPCRAQRGGPQQRRPAGRSFPTAQIFGCRPKRTGTFDRPCPRLALSAGPLPWGVWDRNASRAEVLGPGAFPEEITSPVALINFLGFLWLSKIEKGWVGSAPPPWIVARLSLPRASQRRLRQLPFLLAWEN